MGGRNVLEDPVEAMLSSRGQCTRNVLEGPEEALLGFNGKEECSRRPSGSNAWF